MAEKNRNTGGTDNMAGAETAAGPDPRIVKFIRKQHVLTLATAVGGEPWCASIFYAWLDEPGCFVFTSDEQTRHASDASRNDFVSGCVALETRIVGRVQGVQFQGVMRRAEELEALAPAARKAYLKRFPYAAAMPLNLWTIEPTLLKLTDNRLGFGKKIVWRRAGSTAEQTGKS